jgi:exonuclease SbcC
LINYLSRLILHNFQSHKSTSIELAPPGQLTVIVGPSDNGKTAIIRALKLLAYNSPQGMDYIRVGENECTVHAVMADGNKVTRQRTRGGVNRYILESEGQHKQIFEGFGTTVPLEVQQVLGMTPISIGDMEFHLNLSEQLDGPFLGNSVPVTAKAKVLGKLSGVEEVDYANKTLGTDLYREKREKEATENQIKHLTKQIEEYNYLDELKPIITAVEKQLADLKAKLKKRDDLMDLRIKLNATKTALEAEKQKLKALAVVDIISPLLAKAETDTVKRSRLITLQTNLMSTKKEIEQANKILQNTQEIEAVETLLSGVSAKVIKAQRLRELQISLTMLKAEKEQNQKTLDHTREIDIISQKIEEVAEKIAKRNKLVSLRSLQQGAREEIIKTEAAIAEMKHKEQAAIEAYKNTLQEIGVCPTCGSELDPEKMIKEAV